VLNADADWDRFTPSWYKEHNYSALGDDDRQILECVRDFFASAGVHDGRGLDAGSGSNLYPALSMLPFCQEIVLLDFSAANVAWLQAELSEPNRSWNEFWHLLAKDPAYADVVDFRALLRKTAHVSHGNVLDLPKDEYDMGTMFFVAESMSTELSEFRQAVHGFIGALRKDAPFAIAFMIGSKGYTVDGRHFPAVEIDGHDVQQCLKGVAQLASIADIEMRDPPLRHGYDGMLVATGRAGGGAEDGGLSDEDRATAKHAGDLAGTR
jgi:hypothetical protein